MDFRCYLLLRLRLRKRVILPQVKLDQKKKYNASTASEMSFSIYSNGYNLRSRALKKMYKSRKQLADLNDDCLLYLFDFLTAIDLLHLGMMSDRFAAVSAKHLLSAELDMCIFMKWFSLDEANRVLEKFGPYIRKIDFRSIEYNSDVSMLESYMILVVNHCCNIDEIFAVSMIANQIASTGLLPKYSKTLVSFSVPSKQLNDEHAYFVSQLLKLSAAAVKSAAILGANMTELTNLKYLDLSDCRLDPRYLEMICESNRLSYLDISDCSYLDNECFQTIVETQSDSLTSLKISFHYLFGDVTILWDIRALKNLEVFTVFGKDIQEDFIETLAAKRKDTLTSLKLHYYLTVTMTDEELNNILELSNLETLFLFVFPITKEYLFKIPEKLHKLKTLEVQTIGSVTPEEMMEVAKRLKYLKYCNMYDR